MGIFDQDKDIYEVIDEAIKTYHPESNRTLRPGSSLKENPEI